MRWDSDQQCTRRHQWLWIHDMATKIIYFTVNGRPEQAEFPVDCPAQDVKGRSRQLGSCLKFTCLYKRFSTRVACLTAHTYTYLHVQSVKLISASFFKIIMYICQTPPMFTMILHLLKEGKCNVFMRSVNRAALLVVKRTVGGCLSCRQWCSCHWQLLTRHTGLTCSSCALRFKWRGRTNVKQEWATVVCHSEYYVYYNL